MNKTKIEWADYTWNPVTGCLHGCKYCYARRIANRFKGWTDSEGDTHYDTILTTDNPIRELQEPLYIAPKERLGKWPKAPYPYGFIPTFHRYRLDEPIRKTRPRKIFVCSMADLFGDWVPDEWIQEVFAACEKAPWHTYLFLTKNYLKASDFKFRDNWWIGKTITNNENSRLCEGDPWNIDGIHRANQFLSIEPLQGEIKSLKYYLYSFKWVIIGQQTGLGAVPPKPEWVQSIIDQCGAAGVPVFLKDNLKWPEKIQEWPE